MMTCFSTAIVLLIALISRASSSCSPITTTQADEGSELCYCADVEKPMDCAELPGPNRGDPGIPSGRLIRLDDNSIHCVPIDQHTACNGSPPNPTCGSAADGCNVVVLHDQSPICAAPGFGGPGTAVQDCMIDSPFCCKLLDPLVVGPPGGGGGDDPAIINEYRCTGVSGEPCNCIVGPDNDLADTGVLVELVDGLTCVQTSAQCQGTHRNVFGGICPAPCTQSTDGRCFFESASGLGPTCSAEDRCIDDPRLFDELTRRMTLTQELMMQSTPLLLLPDDPTRSLSMESTSRTMLQRTPATISSPATIFSSEEQSENAVESNDDANTEQVVSNDDVAESNSSALLIGLICGGVCLVVGCIAFAVALRASSSSNATQRSNDSINESNASVNNQYGSINVDDKRPMAQDAVYSQSHSQNSSEYANAPELAHSQYDAY